MKYMKLNIVAMALAIGIPWGVAMILIGWSAMYGYANGMVQALQSVYLGFEPTWLGGLVGGIWGLVDGFIGGAVFAWIYNYFAKK